MSDTIERHITAVAAAYRPLIIGDGSRREGGSKLWGQFTDAVAAYRRHGKDVLPAIIERVNEMAVARILIDGPTFARGKILYESPIAADGRRIDFVRPEAEGGGNLYVEVKTVRPTAEDSEDNWKKYEARKARHSDHVTYHVEKRWMGAAIYGNAFSARSKFMEYTRDFETRLTEADKVQPGRGLLVFCRSGLQWEASELEDFADFYLTGRHRQDDPFANMEAEALRTGNIELKRNIAAFGFMKRPMNCITEEEWIPDVRGPILFR
jgi:hypothetical protein